MNITLNVDNKPIRIESKELIIWQKKLKKILKLLGLNRNLSLDEKKYNIEDFKELSELEYLLEFVINENKKLLQLKTKE